MFKLLPSGFLLTINKSINIYMSVGPLPDINGNHCLFRTQDASTHAVLLNGRPFCSISCENSQLWNDTIDTVRVKSTYQPIRYYFVIQYFLWVSSPLCSHSFALEKLCSFFFNLTFCFFFTFVERVGECLKPMYLVFRDSNTFDISRLPP